MAGIFGFKPNNTLGALYLTPPTGNEAHWRRALANQGGIAPEPGSIGEGLKGLAEKRLRQAGMPKRQAQRLAGFALDFSPVGDVSSAADAGTDIRHGNYAGGALIGGASLLGLIPLLGDAARATATRQIRGSRMFGGNRIFDKLPLQFGGPSPLAHVTEPGFAYRTVDPPELLDAQNIGQFLAKPNARYGGEKQWVIGGQGAYFNPNSDKEVLRVPLDRINANRPVYFGDVQIVTPR